MHHKGVVGGSWAELSLWTETEQKSMDIWQIKEIFITLIS